MLNYLKLPLPVFIKATLYRLKNAMNKNTELIIKFINNKLLAIAITISLVFCAELTVMGHTKYINVISGTGENYIDFPNIFTRLRINVEFILLNLVYVFWIVQNFQKANYFCFSRILKSNVIFLTAALLSYPYTNDVYLYLQYGLMSLNGINPFLNTASQFASELTPFIHWGQASSYGPISQLFFMLAALVVPISPAAGVYLLKIFCVLLHIINAYLIWNFLKDFQNRSQITIAYLVNPFLLSEHVVNAHVDVIVSTILLVLIGCIKSRRYVTGILTIWVGFLTKTLPIIWMPLFFVFIIRQKRWNTLAIASFLSVVLIAILSYTILSSPAAWKSLLNLNSQTLTARSLHHLLNLLLDKYEYLSPEFVLPAQENIPSIFKFITYLIFVGYYVLTLLKCYFKRLYSEYNLILSIGWVTLVLFLFATPWLMPWYASILLPITALNINSRSFDSRLFVFTSLSFYISSSCIYGTGGGQTGISAIVSIITVGPPIVVLLLKSKFRQLRVHANY